MAPVLHRRWTPELFKHIVTLPFTFFHEPRDLILVHVYVHANLAVRSQSSLPSLPIIPLNISQWRWKSGRLWKERRGLAAINYRTQSMTSPIDQHQAPSSSLSAQALRSPKYLPGYSPCQSVACVFPCLDCTFVIIVCAEKDDSWTTNVPWYLNLLRKYSVWASTDWCGIFQSRVYNFSQGMRSRSLRSPHGLYSYPPFSYLPSSRTIRSLATVWANLDLAHISRLLQ